MKKPVSSPRAPRAGGAKPTRSGPPSRARSAAPRGDARSSGAPRRFSRDDAAPPRRTSRPDRGEGGESFGGASRARPANPYERAQRPRRPDYEGGDGPRGFTVTLDPDVARVFRGDASVNKALRLVLQLMQVVQGPPRDSGERRSSAPRGYQGSDEARGFSRKPRFNDDEDADIPSE